VKEGIGLRQKAGLKADTRSTGSFVQFTLFCFRRRAVGVSNVLFDWPWICRNIHA
jgi:hypothetical protein